MFEGGAATAEDRIDGFSLEWRIIRMTEKSPLSSKATSSALPEAKKPAGIMKDLVCLMRLMDEQDRLSTCMT